MSGGADRPSRAVIERSKQLSWLLRHGAAEVALPMDEAGWAPIDAVLAATGMDRDALEEAVRTNRKRRLQLDGERVRACQGHSLANTAITREGLERSWRMFDGTASLWHGTTRAAIEGIARAGIIPLARTHVHLAPSPDAHVGKRAQVAFLLEVDPQRLRDAGLEIFVAPNGVVLCRAVPPHCIVDVRASTHDATAQLVEVRALLGLG